MAVNASGQVAGMISEEAKVVALETSNGIIMVRALPMKLFNGDVWWRYVVFFPDGTISLGKIPYRLSEDAFDGGVEVAESN